MTFLRSLIILCSVVLIHLALVFLGRSIEPWNLFAFFGSIPFVFSLILTLDLFMLEWRRSMRLAGALLAMFWALLLTGNCWLYRYFFKYVTYNKLSFLYNDPGYVWSLFMDYSTIDWPLFLLMAFLFTIYFLVFERLRSNRPRGWKTKLVALLALISSFKLLTMQNLETFLDPISASALSSYKVFRKGGERKLIYHSVRDRVAAERLIKSGPNVLLIIHESWGKQAFDPVSSKNGAMPCLEEEVAHNADYVVFNQAFSQSPATEVSLTSILTGLSPIRSGADFHRAPFLWNYFDTQAFMTYFATSQRLTWGNLDEFILSSPPKHLFEAEQSRAPVVHHIGIDDHELFHAVGERINQDSGPFVSVVFSNGMHHPFQEKSQHAIVPKEFSTPYKRAAYLVDHAQCGLLRFLKKQNLFDETLIILTSDHGDRDQYLHSIPRIVSSFDEIINIPLVIKVPKSWTKNRPLEVLKLRGNANKNVANIDIVPTILAMQEKWDGFDGMNLWEQIPEERVIVATNVNDLRIWETASFALVSGSKRLLYSSPGGVTLYDISSDPEQKRPLEGALWEQELKDWISGAPLLQSIIK